MKKICFLLSLFAISTYADTGAYDPLADLVSTTKKEISVRDTVEGAKDQLTSPKALKLKNGYWQFFQGKKDAKPGEFCTAVYLQNDKMITIMGPGGNGTYLSFLG